MAENSNTQPSDMAQAEFQSLSQSNRKLLAVSEDVLKEFHPKPGVLHDLPQITIEPGNTAMVCRLAKEDSRLALHQLLCLACVDYEEYFQLVYFLRSFEPERILVVKTNVPSDDPRVPSVAPVWRAAEWYEREAHELYGVQFDGHPGLTPLLLYEGFDGFPGRREYPFHDYQEF
ncbi:MAG: NADH-quinone oxidoreductase subunit C [Dehalococcoidia bacterium]|nr:NADH-quinone oxidoreductase subunit C [Dehalococcoidia bacterium]MDP6227971.1 NADH-quinone oxidoreductase subunit C [Dehalococcoidia bacterium]MDP7083179.1 NADH-quinone oxidoreductase subunit C [Dehalococcoidia bacterium]MDP7199941.1 NADH-quinone oxidoreductase subunit C [Dehalococcoidia bacterium]MDP7510416.1 NADH-quinone oxidoreductase subunit C [Dehalococcoidia bacterium]